MEFIFLLFIFFSNNIYALQKPLWTFKSPTDTAKTLYFVGRSIVKMMDDHVGIIFDGAILDGTRAIISATTCAIAKIPEITYDGASEQEK